MPEEVQLRKSLSKDGLSMSQAQTVSNLANQNATALTQEMLLYNNVSKKIQYKGQELVQVKPNPIPANISEMLAKVGRYYALQAFLMENIKTKDSWLQEIRRAIFVPSEELQKEQPEAPDLEAATLKTPVNEDWGWAQLSPAEMAEYWEVEAKASHLGQFIHRGGKLDQLRKNLPTIVELEWHTTGGMNAESYPINVIAHHNIKDLTEMHNNFANEHKTLEQRVNYFKAKVKNSVTEENANIAKENGIAIAEVNKVNNAKMGEYQKLCIDYEGKRRVEEEAFEVKRNEDMKFVAALRIKVDPRFQETVDELMPKKNEDDEVKVG